MAKPYIEHLHLNIFKQLVIDNMVQDFFESTSRKIIITYFCTFGAIHIG